MSRRGRGIGGMSKAVMEQLSSAKNEFGKDLNVCPPETFPPLMFRPVRNPEEGNQEYLYTLMVKKELHEYYQNSEYYVTLDTKKPDIERYSDRFHILNNNNTPKLHIDLSRYPKELWIEQHSPNKKKRKSQKGQPKVNIKCAKLNNEVKDVDIKKKLDELEIKETVGDDGEKKEDKDESFIEEEEEDIDEEMDEGTDYINSYFDDGENFADEDDALEEGGVF